MSIGCQGGGGGGTPSRIPEFEPPLGLEVIQHAACLLSVPHQLCLYRERSAFYDLDTPLNVKKNPKQNVEAGSTITANALQGYLGHKKQRPPWTLQ